MTIEIKNCRTGEVMLCVDKQLEDQVWGAEKLPQVPEKNQILSGQGEKALGLPILRLLPFTTGRYHLSQVINTVEKMVLCHLSVCQLQKRCFREGT